ncbi:MAG: polysaccharide deacetylase family protein [Anaeromyxobacteraceae bacterium]
MAGSGEPGTRWFFRRAVKVATAGALVGLGARHAVRAWQRRRVGGVRVVLLSYHRATHDFGESAREGLASMFVSQETLRRHLEVAGRLREFVSLADARRLLAEGSRATARDVVVVTFDDGYADNHHVALPLLTALGVPATFFLATGYVGTSHRFPHDRLHAALHELVRRGLPAERAGLPPRCSSSSRPAPRRCPRRRSRASSSGCRTTGSSRSPTRSSGG